MSDARPSLSTFANPPADCRPRMRWWWFGPDVERGELARELTAMHDAGIGGVEVAFVYPLSRVEHPFLSPAFLDDLRFAADTARELEMTFDLTIGSGWSFGGPHITDDTAARRVRWDVRDLGALETEVLLAPTQRGDAFLGAYVGDGSLQEPPREFDRLEPDQDSPARLTVPAGFGPRVLALAWSVTTGQQVKRAAAGAEGPVLDHYSAEATRDHLRAVADPMLDAVPAHLVGSVFCDSLEAYGADWTTDLPAEFERRNGHPLLTELWRLRFDSPGSGSFRAEYYETLGELYERNFLDVVREWAAGRGVPFRVQSYGAPPARLRSYRHADLAEGEGWGWLGIPQTRWASSAAHHDGTTIVSSETWTWVHSPSFRATPLDLKGEAHEHFLLGINQLVGHGWPYSAPDARGLGWFFYASGALDDRNAWWPAMPKLTTYLARLSWLLRQGEPVRDVLLYLPAGEVYPMLGMEQGGTLDLWRQSRDRIGAAIPAAIRHAGLDFDLVDDATLRELTPSASTTVVLPFVSSLPGDTAEVLRAVRHAGGTVIAVVEEGTDARGQVPGDAVTVASLADELLARSTADLTLEPASPTIGFVHRRLDEGDAYLIVNTGATAESFVARPRSLGADWQLWNPDDARVVGAGDASARIDLTLAPYQAVVLVTGKAFAASTSASAGTETTPETDRANSIERDDLLGNAAIAWG
ncbi:MAG: glycosyl hydrolase, partial [Humibacter sp.]